MLTSFSFSSFQNLSISIDRWLVPPKPKKPETLYQAVLGKVRKGGFGRGGTRLAHFAT